MGWISVDDRLPEDFKTVIIPGGCAFYDTERKKWYTLMEAGHREPKEVYWPVTHWMPFPKPPTEEQDQPRR